MRSTCMSWPLREPAGSWTMTLPCSPPSAVVPAPAAARASCAAATEPGAPERVAPQLPQNFALAGTLAEHEAHNSSMTSAGGTSGAPAAHKLQARARSQRQRGTGDFAHARALQTPWRLRVFVAETVLGGCPE